MILADAVIDTLRWVGFAVLFFVAIGARVLPLRNWKYALGLVAVAVLGIVLAWGLGALGAPVVVVKIRSGGVYEKTVGRLYARTTYRFQDGKEARLAAPAGETLVVNDSTRELSIETTYYGSLSFPSRPVPVPAMAVFPCGTSIDYVGPDDPPPAQVSSTIPFDIKTHLTW